MKHQRRIWDSIADDYDVIWEVPDYTPIFRFIIQEAEIDLGMVLGVDFSKPMLKQALKKTKELGLHNINFILADAHNLPFRDEYFDVVTSCFTFAFLPNPLKVAGEMARVAKHGGRVASVEWERPPLDFWAEIREKGGIHDFPESELTRILLNSGFRKICAKRIQVLHRRVNVSEELVKKSQLLAVKLMGLEEKDAQWFFQKIREEYRKLSPEKKRDWLPVLYVGIK